VLQFWHRFGFGVTWPDHEDQDNRQHRGARERAEDSEERHVTIAQCTEAPVGQAAAADADEVHDTVAGRAQLRTDNLAEDRHVVRVEESPPDAKKNEERLLVPVALLNYLDRQMLAAMKFSVMQDIVTTTHA
jgi:hypothetical protein